jgi:competence protein ComEC
VIAVYTVLTGFLPPVTRSALMIFFVLLPLLTRRAVDSLTAFSIAVALTQLVDRTAYLKPDFQLSYLCIFGLVVLGPGIKETTDISFPEASRRTQRLLSLFVNKLLHPIAQAVAAQLMVLPVLAILFHQFPLIGFVSNLILIPYFGFYLISVGAVALLGLLNPELAQVFAPLACNMSELFDSMAAGFAAVPGASMPMLAFPWYLIAGYYVLLLTGPHMFMRNAPGAREMRRGRLLLRLAAIAAFLAWWPVLESQAGLISKSRNEVGLTMLDVGQGDCLLLESNNNEIIMVDAGKPQAIRVILDYLRSRGIEEIAALVLTHADNDHSGSAQALIERFPVRQVLVGPHAEAASNMQPILAAASQRGIQVIDIARGDVVHAAQARLHVLNPAPDAPLPLHKGAYASDSNERSLVFRLEYGDTHFMLMGDAGVDVENELLAKYGPQFFVADVLKAGHHGSASASGAPFVNATHPQLALFSAGRDNSFGHPTPQVVERVKQTGAEALTTAEIGSVDIRTDGKRLWWRTSR